MLILHLYTYSILPSHNAKIMEVAITIDCQFESYDKT